jgi:hypothetical protein
MIDKLFPDGNMPDPPPMKRQRELIFDNMVGEFENQSCRIDAVAGRA